MLIVQCDSALHFYCRKVDAMNRYFSMYPLFAVILLLYSPIYLFAAPSLDTTYGHIPLAFTVNEGQAPSSIRFTAQGSGCGMAFSPSGTTFHLSRETAASVAKRAAKKSVVFEDDPARDQPEYESFALKLAFIGANETPEIQGEDRLPWNNNYFIGNDPDKWRTDVPNYKKIRFKEVYKGIDLVYYGNQRRVKYDFVVKPGETPEQILLKYDFGEAGGSLSVNEKGELVVKTAVGEMIEKKPYCYQKVNGKEVEVEVKYEVVEGGMYRFRVGEYDGRYDLVIDPEVVYSTYLGGDSQDRISDIAVDSEGCAYVTGETSSTDYPISHGAYDTRYHNVFISKINALGTAFSYSTFFGEIGTRGDCSIAVDQYGNACITGRTGSSDFPITENAIDKQYKGGEIFITKFNSMGSGLIFSTFFGGSETEISYAIAYDKDENIYFTGYTYSADYPTTPGAFKEKNELGGGQIVFLTKLDSEASKVVYSTFIGFGVGLDIQVNSAGEAYLIGQTPYSYPDFPVSDNAFDKLSTGNDKLFITKVNNIGSQIVYSTLLGGSSENYARGIAVDASGHAYVCGITESNDFPTTPGAFITTLKKTGMNGFVTKLNDDGSNLEYSTYITDQGHSAINDIDVDENGFAFVTGVGSSKLFPVTSDALKWNSQSGYNNAILSILSENGSHLIYSTLWGGNGGDEGIALALDSKDNVYIAGLTYSFDFPRSSGAIDDTLTISMAGYFDGFISKFHFVGIGNEVQSENGWPTEFRITSIHPNPFNPSTTIEFLLPEQGQVKLMVYTITGQKIYEAQIKRLSAGIQKIRWDGKDRLNRNVSSGVYLIRLDNGMYSLAEKVLFLK